MREEGVAHGRIYQAIVRVSVIVGSELYIAVGTGVQAGVRHAVQIEGKWNRDVDRAVVTLRAGHQGATVIIIRANCLRHSVIGARAARSYRSCRAWCVGRRRRSLALTCGLRIEDG